MHLMNRGMPAFHADIHIDPVYHDEYSGIHEYQA